MFEVWKRVLFVLNGRKKREAENFVPVCVLSGRLVDAFVPEKGFQCEDHTGVQTAAGCRIDSGLARKTEPHPFEWIQLGRRLAPHRQWQQLQRQTTEEGRSEVQQQPLLTQSQICSFYVVQVLD